MLDSITETIAHFIGHFHLGTEEARLRQSYEEFLHLKAQQNEIQVHDPQQIQTSAYQLDGFDPALTWTPRSHEDSFSPGLPKLVWSEIPLMPFSAGLLALRTGESLTGPDIDIWTRLPPADAGPTLTVPSSVATLTWQALALQDDDILGPVAAAGFAPAADFLPVLDRLVEIAQKLAATSVPETDGAAPWVAAAADLKAQVQAAEAKADALPEGATSFTVTGTGATGMVVNGKVVTEMPVLEMPAYLAKDDGDAPEDVLPEELRDNPLVPHVSGHEVIAGANVLENAVAVNSMWIDAAVIVVAGNVTRIDAIDQVNVLSDRDCLTPQQGSDAPSILMNAASNEQSATSAGAAADGAQAVIPAQWAVTRIEGDLICYNWVSQTSYVTDHDMAVLTSMGSSTYVSLGENLVANITMLAELGYRYDMIVVGGNMYDISYVYQCNVLMDDDTVSGVGASGSDNVLFNSASIHSTGVDEYRSLTPFGRDALDAAAHDGAMPALSQGDLFDDDTLSVLYVTGDLVTMNVVSQVNVLGDNDQVALAAEAAVQAGSDLKIVTGSNVLANEAVIREFGIDSTVMAGGDIYSDALIHQAGLVESDANPTGVAMQGLANEAVAFLADDMIDGAAGADDAGSPVLLPMDGGSLDVMQTMLA
ncbi:hypothetical protein [Paracoccus rhizosphaerae]|uniref:Type I secretion protein n=1 Tax=Paracoccus rhizosphaerae TaxID=1133347 RepID=A0ABV6CMT9_9RHOB|nr:hypothetical protein [Paracoccus rhizosphaerae]